MESRTGDSFSCGEETKSSYVTSDSVSQCTISYFTTAQVAQFRVFVAMHDIIH